LGITYKVTYSDNMRTIFASQPEYAETVLQRANMQDCSEASTPQPAGLVYSKKDSEDKAEGDSKIMTQSQYLSTIMAISWLAVNTRFDLKFAHSKLASFVAAPGVVHKKALHHLLRYLKGTINYGVQFLWKAGDDMEGVPKMRVYTDSSHHDDRDTSASTICFVVLINGTPVSMLSKLTRGVQSCINHDEQEAIGAAVPSPHSAETLVAVNKSQRDAIWVANVLAEMLSVKREDMPPIAILIDNTGAIKLVLDPVQHSANKHIMHQLAELRERFASGRFCPIKVATANNLADAGTKQLTTVAASRLMLAFLAAPIGMRPDIIDDFTVRTAEAKMIEQWRASRSTPVQQPSPAAALPTPTLGQEGMLDG
jgi:hypothetical protein